MITHLHNWNKDKKINKNEGYNKMRILGIMVLCITLLACGNSPTKMSKEDALAIAKSYESVQYGESVTGDLSKDRVQYLKALSSLMPIEDDIYRRLAQDSGTLFDDTVGYTVKLLETDDNYKRVLNSIDSYPELVSKAILGSDESFFSILLLPEVDNVRYIIPLSISHNPDSDLQEDKSFYELMGYKVSNSDVNYAKKVAKLYKIEENKKIGDNFYRGAKDNESLKLANEAFNKYFGL